MIVPLCFRALGIQPWTCHFCISLFVIILEIYMNSFNNYVFVLRFITFIFLFHFYLAVPVVSSNPLMLGGSVMPVMPPPPLAATLPITLPTALSAAVPAALTTALPNVGVPYPTAAALSTGWVYFL